MVTVAEQLRLAMQVFRTWQNGARGDLRHKANVDLLRARGYSVTGQAASKNGVRYLAEGQAWIEAASTVEDAARLLEPRAAFDGPIKPCPFCGSSNLFVGEQSAVTWGVECQECDAKIEAAMPEKVPHDSELLGDVQQATLDKAILRWNRRD